MTKFIFIILIILLFLFIYRKFRVVFGKIPSKKQLDIIQKSINFVNNSFINFEEFSHFPEGVSIFKIIRNLFFKRFPNTKPKKDIPITKTNILNIPSNIDYLIWFGHSSYLIQINGIKYLIDPVFSKNASPVFFVNRAFKGSSYYTVDMMPEIDYLVITHDHYDHLDYPTVNKLRNKVKKIILPLGVSSHFKYWNFKEENIIELDWFDEYSINKDTKIISTTARHSSARFFKTKKTLWSSYILENKDIKIFLGGDGGYGKHFKEINEKYGNFDLVILENGQYNEFWPYVHMFPEETLKASLELKSKYLLPIHNSKFKLSTHPWNEPMIKLDELNSEKKINILTPKIGDIVNLNHLKKNNFEKWFKK